MRWINARSPGLAILAILFPLSASAQQDVIKNAMRAGPASIAEDAAVMNWDLETIREGSNGWTCLPDRPDTPGDDPWCVNEPWLNFHSCIRFEHRALVYVDRARLHADGRYAGE